jgi:shikimate dehydrogenase
MRLALLGKGISHSRSPDLYRKLLGPSLDSYELLDYPTAEEIPSLSELAKKFDGLSITAPFKKHFFSQVEVFPSSVKKIGAINCLSFRQGKIIGTNTDFIAVKNILTSMADSQKPNLVLLGSGSMAAMTKLIADELQLPLTQYSRQSEPNLSGLDLSLQHVNGKQTIIINSCSRDFVFQGKIHPEAQFWDYNYNFQPHLTTLPHRVKSYIDGSELLELQAIEAVNFWRETNSKLKC